MSNPLNDLAAWLRAQLDDDERIAREAADNDSGRWFMGDGWNITGYHEEWAP